MARPAQTRLAALALAVAAVLLAAAPQAAEARSLRQMDPHISALLDNVLLRPFANKILSVPACLFDSALPSLDIQQCPGLFTMLDALQLGNLNPPAVCDLSCAMQFSQFDEGCTGDLRAAFGDEPSDIGRLGTDFFASCDEVLPPLLPPSSAGGPAPAPAQA